MIEIMLVQVLLDTTIFVHYGFLTLTLDGADAEGQEAGFRGQVNGLCGGAVPGELHMRTGTHTGDVGVRVELHSAEPVLEDAWLDVVEANFSTWHDDLMLTGFDTSEGPVDLPPGSYRVRFCAKDMQLGQDEEVPPDHPPVDIYLLQFWPAAGQDRIVRQSSEVATYWHRQGVEPEWTSDELAARVSAMRENRAERLAEEADAELEELWDGQIPDDPRLVTGGWATANLWRVDPALTQALVDADDRLCRAVTAWCAERMLAAVGLRDRPWATPVVDSLRDGTPVPNIYEFMRTLPPLPMPPDFGDDQAAAQHIVLQTIANVASSTTPLVAACEICGGARDVPGSGNFDDDIRAQFPQLFEQ